MTKTKYEQLGVGIFNSYFSIPVENVKISIKTKQKHIQGMLRAFYTFKGRK